ncbi:hypothetical protein KUCAC02_023702 [Chaenocephalus aceratus]|uniref:Uncharacterized protein n=1 Tax=Chaenocephalus aceratus TaxID=36190 RepID=A0ACB9WFZ0_CHAAC|nr:hypothetical protein KUCAC02_023702 [Chaenocephalus aceratus]
MIFNYIKWIYVKSGKGGKHWVSSPSCSTQLQKSARSGSKVTVRRAFSGSTNTVLWRYGVSRKCAFTVSFSKQDGKRYMTCSVIYRHMTISDIS